MNNDKESGKDMGPRKNNWLVSQKEKFQNSKIFVSFLFLRKGFPSVNKKRPSVIIGSRFFEDVWRIGLREVVNINVLCKDSRRAA